MSIVFIFCFCKCWGLRFFTNASVNMFQPDVICLGSEVSGAGYRILELIQNAIKENAFARFGKKHTQMKIASLGNDAGIIGAALLWKDIF